MPSAPADPAAPVEPMEARLVAALPADTGWQFEPKWDGFRAIAARCGDQVTLHAKSGKSLARYFPEVVAMLGSTRTRDFLLDGELILPIDGRLSFDALQQRLHPAASRIAKLSRETPAELVLFDCLRLDGAELSDKPLETRRKALEQFVDREGSPALRLSPATGDPAEAQGWLARSGGALDGIIAKPLGEPYRPGKRAMLKLKPLRTADCVVGGYRLNAGCNGVASLLLGLYNADARLDLVGFIAGFADADRAALLEQVEPLAGGAGFTGKTPGGPSRWRKEGEAEWVPLAPELVVEVQYDQVTANRFRHGARFVRWRPDKAARQCTFDQLAPPLEPSQLAQLLG